MIPALLRQAFPLAWFLPLLASPLLAQVTESPHTVAPGKLLVEMDGLKLSFDREDGEKFRGIAVASTLVSAGITDSFDVQAGVDVFLKHTVESEGARDSHSGFGDLAFRAKWTFWRNEKHGAALAMIPYVKIPSNTGGVGAKGVEGGVIVPWSMNLPGGVVSGAMFQWDVVRNDDDNGYDAHWHATGFIQRNLTRALSVYAEGTLLTPSTGFSHRSGTLGVGALVQLTKNVQLDYELQRGITSRAADWTHVFRVNWEW